MEEVQLDDYRLACTIAESRRFTLSVTARAVPYAVAFSFTKHDFGACFVGAAGSAPQSSTRTLQITNNEMDEDVAIDCEYQNTPELELAGFKPTLLAAGGDPLEAIIGTAEHLFKPRKCVRTHWSWHNAFSSSYSDSTSADSIRATRDGKMQTQSNLARISPSSCATTT